MPTEPASPAVPSQGDIINQRLAEIGMTVHAFARAMGLSHTYIWNVVHGHRHMTAPETIARAASILGIPQDWLFVSARRLPDDIWMILQRHPQLVQALRVLDAKLDDREAHHATR
jgi:plasmid maintenance system antidote protein VapI